MNDAKYTWPHKAQLALSIVVNVEEGAEASIADGDPGPDAVDELGLALRGARRNYPNESNYRYGINEGAPRILKLLSDHDVSATFTSAALALTRSPQLAKQIVAAGHEICAHGYRWVHQFKMSEQDEAQFIAQAVSHIEQACGSAPRGWLSRYLFTEHTRRLLVDAGFAYHMDDYSRDAPFWDNTDAGPIVVMPYALDSNDMKLWTSPAFSPADWLTYALDTFNELYAEGASQPRMMSLGIHLRVMGRPGRVGYLRQFIQHVAQHPNVWIATRAQIAEHFADQCPYQPGQ